MPPPSLARQFYDSIVQAGNAAAVIAAIRKLITNPPSVFETEWLDFKVEDPNPRVSEKKNKEIWSEALGGFANNQGGVLIWGVDARKEDHGGVKIDAACGESPISNPIGLKSRLKDLLTAATDPPLPGVEIEPYEIASNPGKGFVVCFIPEGGFKPYRSDQFDRNYHLRIGDSFHIMPRAVLQSMFFPQMTSHLEAQVSVSTDIVERVGVINFAARLYNKGTASAVKMFAHIIPNRRLKTLQAGEHWHPRGPVGIGLRMTMLDTLHPGDDCQFFFAVFEEQLHADTPVYVPIINGIVFDIFVCMEHQLPQSMKVYIPGSELRMYSQKIHIGQAVPSPGGP